MQIASLIAMILLSKGNSRVELAFTNALSVPPALAGAMIGIYIYRRCSDRLFLIIVNAMLFASGVTLLF